MTVSVCQSSSKIFIVDEAAEDKTDCCCCHVHLEAMYLHYGLHPQK